MEGLAYIHEMGFMHRDVKPSNIYLMRNGKVRIGDFSISREIGKDHKKEENGEEGEGDKTGNVTTRHYRAP